MREKVQLLSQLYVQANIKEGMPAYEVARMYSDAEKEINRFFSENPPEKVSIRPAPTHGSL